MREDSTGSFVIVTSCRRIPKNVKAMTYAAQKSKITSQPPSLMIDDVRSSMRMLAAMAMDKQPRADCVSMAAFSDEIVINTVGETRWRESSDSEGRVAVWQALGAAPQTLSDAALPSLFHASSSRPQRNMCGRARQHRDVPPVQESRAS